MVTAGNGRSLRAFACFGALFLGGAAAGQAGGTNQGGNTAPAEITVSVVFRGGTLAEYASALRAAAEGVNILVPEQAGEVRVPPITLKNTTVYAALDALSDLVGADHQVKVRMIMTPAQTAPVYTMAVARYRAPQMPGNMPGMTAQAGQDVRMVRVFSLRSLADDPAEVF